MAPTPKKPGDRVRKPAPKGGDWTPAPGEGWQHGDIPEPPEALHADTLEAWALWFSSWWAAFWSPDVLPAIRLIANLYDSVMHDGADPSKLTPMMDKHGMTPYGRKQLLWMPSDGSDEPAAEPLTDDLSKKRDARSRKLA